MTKKDYELIAEVIYSQRYTLSNKYHTWLDEISRLLATRLEQDNPRFDRNKFLQACGIDTNDTFDENGNRDNRGI